jgi:hypothetical protein
LDEWLGFAPSGGQLKQSRAAITEGALAKQVVSVLPADPEGTGRRRFSWLIAQADLLAWAVEAEAGYSARHLGEHRIEQERFAASHRLASGILAKVIAQRPCRQCGGHGSLMKCPHCGGRGQIFGYTPWGTPGGATCPSCRGTGQPQGAHCPRCSGTGYDR